MNQQLNIVGGSGSNDHRDILQQPESFFLVVGGPLFQLLRRSHLADESLALVRRRVLVISLFAWLPLLALSALSATRCGAAPDCRF